MNVVVPVDEYMIQKDKDMDLNNLIDTVVIRHQDGSFHMYKNASVEVYGNWLIVYAEHHHVTQYALCDIEYEVIQK